MTGTLGPWVVLFVIVGGMLALDLLVLNRDAKPVSFRRAGASSAVWISLALGFGVFVAATLGSEAAGEYLAGYLIELSLSVDNVFVFALIFAAFAVPVASRRWRTPGTRSADLAQMMPRPVSALSRNQVPKTRLSTMTMGPL